MKKLIAALTIITALSLALPAAADHRPKTHCSESGDFCVSVRKVDGVRKLRIALAAKYFSRYTLCVTGPNGDRTCKDFRIEQRDNGTFGDSVRWRQHFPDEGAGAYTVIWKNDGGFRSDRLGFHAS